MFQIDIILIYIYLKTRSTFYEYRHKLTGLRVRSSAVNALTLYQQEDVMNTNQEINATLKALANSSRVSTGLIHYRPISMFNYVRIKPEQLL